MQVRIHKQIFKQMQIGEHVKPGVRASNDMCHLTNNDERAEHPRLPKHQKCVLSFLSQACSWATMVLQLCKLTSRKRGSGRKQTRIKTIFEGNEFPRCHIVNRHLPFTNRCHLQNLPPLFRCWLSGYQVFSLQSIWASFWLLEANMITFITSVIF